MNRERIRQLSDSKKRLIDELNPLRHSNKGEEEGGCGVVGFCCTEPVPGRHIYEPSCLMHNRGNGKGGGIAAVGFVPEQLGVSREVLDDYYMFHIAYLDPGVRSDLESTFITPHFDVAASSELETVDDWETVKGLEVKPPDVRRYFVRVKQDVLDAFIVENQLNALGRREAEDEFVNQNSYRLNDKYYVSGGAQAAFVLSHGRNIMILKVVGYAEAITQYYKIDDLCAHAWIAHQRFPTKGRVWHPGGAHPFAGINMALVHNGDFANYHSVTEYLKQRHIYPQFITDTEVAALLFDLLTRTYHYPLEYIIEAIAPTTEFDFDRLPLEKQAIYRSIQAAHIHGSPDGPWFFIIARNLPDQNTFQLLGITDTAMLRPQVFSFADGDVQVGLICSEKQAIDATLISLAKDDKRICPVADRYWNARGGSHTDGGSFIFNISPDQSGKLRMSCTDKFGTTVPMPQQTESCDFTKDEPPFASAAGEREKELKRCLEKGGGQALFNSVSAKIPAWSFDDIQAACAIVVNLAKDPKHTGSVIEGLTLLNNRKFSTGDKKRSHIIFIVRSALDKIFTALPGIEDDKSENPYRSIDLETRGFLRPPRRTETTLAINARKFPAEGDECDASLLMDAYLKGWRRFISFGCAGQRYIGCGLGPETQDVVIDVYDSSGDYLASGIDGLTINVHGNAQDQLAQIIKEGKLVVHGDVGQTFMYGAKGGEVYVLGNAAGRPLINSVGHPRVIINQTCLDFLGESFMAGDPHNGGGFVILNAVTFDDQGTVIPLNEPYPGSNLFSLASGGAAFIRDPNRVLVDQQLNGGMFMPLTRQDWDLILPYLEENERLFGITLDDLLTVDGQLMTPDRVYRKVVPSTGAASASEPIEVYWDDEGVPDQATIPLSD